MSIDPELASRFAACCRVLGLTVDGRRRPADLPSARAGFAALCRAAHEQCDAWVGLAASGEATVEVLAAISRTSATAKRLQHAASLLPGELSFSYDTGLYLAFRAEGPDDYRLAHAAALADAGAYAEADELVAEVTRRRPDWFRARWTAVAIRNRAERWSDVVELLAPVVADEPADPTAAHAVRVAFGIALAKLGMVAPALAHLDDPSGPIAVAATDGALARALCLRHHGEGEAAAEALQDLYAAHPDNADVEHALSDPSVGLRVTTAARIAARADPWDPATEPDEDDFIDPDAQERKAVLLAEAEQQLGEFIGLDEVKDQVARLKSSVAMALRRQERGLAVGQRAHHLVFAGPPGTGKTTIARVVAKIYCGLGLLKREHVREVHRADLIGQHIGETEAKTNAVIDSALDGVLFLDEAYSLVSTGAKNDFGLVAIDTLLARMENDRDRLVVIIAGYRAELDQFLDTNEGLRSRFTRSIAFPSYTPSELVEIASAMAEARDSVFEAAAADELLAAFAAMCAAEAPDARGVARRSIDVAGNGRFVRNVVERAEEEREHRLDNSGADEFSDDDLMTVTLGDVRASVEAIVRGLGLVAVA
ncbi:type VII secretion AAA-ATPase EccA [Segniliparus rugosus]|uniref:Type VII secretion AAA-ATPase EccA n=1 Tax=Segniliparus rugosus (strain ATCC BAA-974 / DSM 45345 / CCUG 50838 / CIP 108380 / JCM 13579 / CDC 945) TaxID=679197 RepID=E5XM50_SEGRC|nr:type VII secretion AAA-ATPase EccA [Segniliparus rugosus]EFV14570.2 type VII secretion AAA-ATPase EccA [Segniliparus rugosus ATCC BAA-974]